MDSTPDPIVRRDFPRAPDGYDPAAVDAHLEALAARVGGAPTGRRASAADRDLLAAGRLLLGQITGLRLELRNASASLRDQSLAIGETLDRLLELDDSPGPASAETGETFRPDASGSAVSAAAAGVAGPESPPPAEAAAPGPPSGPAAPLPAGAVSASGPASAAVVPSPAPPVDAAPADADAASTLADARLVALDMALGGSDRDRIGEELARRFELPDPLGLADDVLAALG